MGDNMAWNWGISIITFAFGLGIGFLIAYLTIRHNGRIKELEEELSKAQGDLAAYRGKVSQHFEKTAELFEDMTERYRAVYKHMASSAQELCAERPPALQLDIVDRGRLSKDTKTAAAEAMPETLDSAETETDLDLRVSTASHAPSANDDSDDYLGDAPHVPELTDEVLSDAGNASKSTSRA